MFLCNVRVKSPIPKTKNIFEGMNLIFDFHNKQKKKNVYLNDIQIVQDNI